MTTRKADGAGLESALWQLYRDYYDTAEATRRWSISEDLPWDEVRRTLPEDLVEALESLFAIKLKVADYSYNILRFVRGSPGRVWFYATWGYEELRHNLALSDWLLKSGHRDAAQMSALEDAVLLPVWSLPVASRSELVAYGLLQERTTVRCFTHLARQIESAGGDAAVVQLLQYVIADDQAHADYFEKCLKLYRDHEPTDYQEPWRRAVTRFALPVLSTLPDGQHRLETLEQLGLHSAASFSQEIVGPLETSVILA